MKHCFGNNQLEMYVTINFKFRYLNCKIQDLRLVVVNDFFQNQFKYDYYEAVKISVVLHS